MPDISSYALQYGSIVAGSTVPFANADFITLLNSPFDLLITEASPFLPSNASLTEGQLLQLQAQGRIVVAYLDIAVTDDNRPYWEEDWTNNTILGQRDAGVPNASAPDWLKTGVAINFGSSTAPTNATAAIIANIGNPATLTLDEQWKNIVVAQAVNLVTPIAQGGRGYDGIFLDDVAAYFALGLAKNGTAGVLDYANLMAKLVHEVAVAVRSVKSDAYIVANTDPFLASSNITVPALRDQYLRDVDAQLLENPTPVALIPLDPPFNVFASETVLFLFSGSQPILSNADVWGRGNIPYTTSNYSSPAPFIDNSTAGNDTLTGGDGLDNLDGLAGNDIISGGGGNDLLAGGAGSDRIDGGVGIDTLNYASSVGSIYADLAANYTLETGRQTGTVTGAETLLSTDRFLNIESLIGSAFGDRIYGTGISNVINGGAGDDIVYAEGGDDIVISGPGFDILLGGLGIDTLDYSNAVGAVFASLDGYVIETALQAGTVGAATASLSTDLLAQFEGLTGSSFGDRLYGDAAANRLLGNAGDDILYSGGGADTLDGGEGADTLIGEGGADTLSGGGGADRFIFTAPLGTGVDIITDFNKAQGDQLLFLRSAFGLAPADPLNLVINGAATLPGSFLYNSASGNLFFDADGAGGAAAINVANIGIGQALTTSDIILYG